MNPREKPFFLRISESGNGKFLWKSHIGPPGCTGCVRPPSSPRQTLPRLFGSLGRRIGSSGLFSIRSWQASAGDHEAGVEGRRRTGGGQDKRRNQLASFFFGVQGFMQEHLEIRLI